MKILHTADWHLDRSNMEFAYPAIEQAILSAPAYDVFVHAGDLAVHRGHIHPDVAFKLRQLIMLAHNRAAMGSIIVAGNHDLNFNADEVGIVPGVLGMTTAEAGLDKMILAEKPGVVAIGGVRFVMIPTPSKYALMEMQANHGGDEMDPGLLLKNVVQGIIAASDNGMPTYAIYHGTISGARLGNEMVMKAGVDLALPSHAFKGCDAVLAGHIHHRQTIKGDPNIYYTGAAAPLTWNDTRLEPAMLLHDTDLGHVDVVPIPVLSQMVDVELVLDDTPEDFMGIMPQFLAGKFPTNRQESDRLRLTVKAPGRFIDDIKPSCADELVKILKVASVKIVTERTDTAKARVDLKSDWTIDSAFAEWAKLKGLDADTVAAVQAHAIGPMEGAMVDAHLDAHYECRPVNITATNWCQYEKVEMNFDDLGQVVAVTGPNYAGKSNLMRLFLFSRYKRQVSGDKLVDLIRLGEKECVVSEVFEHGADQYRIDRTLKRTTGGGSRADVALFIMSANGWKGINEETAAATQEAIENLIGPYELFRATSYAGQNDVDGLLDLTPSEIKDVLLSVLHRDFDGRLEYIKRNMARAEKKRDGLADKVSERSTLGESLIGMEQNIVALGGQTEDANTDMERYAREIEVMTGVVGRAKDRAAEAKVAHDRAAESRARISGLQGSMASNDADMTGREQEIERAQGDSPINPPTQGEIEAARSAVADTNKALTDSNAARQELVNEWERYDREASTNVRVAAHLVAVTEGKKDKAEDTVTADADRAMLIDQVPCEGGGWFPKGYGDDASLIDMSKCKFLLDAKACADRETANSAVAVAAHVAHYAAKDAHEKLDIEYQCRADLYQESKYMAAVMVDDATGEWNAARNSLAAFEIVQAQAEQHAKASETIRIAKSALEGLTARRDELRDDMETETARLAEFDAMDDQKAIADLKQKQADLEATNRYYKLAQDKYTNALQAKASHDGRLAGMNDRIEELDTATAEIPELTKQVQLWRIAEEAMHRDGIPYLLLEQFAIPALHQTLNTYLENTDIRVSIDNERELVSGKVRSEVVLMFEDHRGIHPLSAASGFQRTAIGMALRNALADLHALATGSRIWMSIQDEGFGTMDEGNLDRAKATIAEIARKRGVFIFISHVPGMADIADSEIKVTDNGGTSQATTAH